jgi:hypothetical protein
VFGHRCGNGSVECGGRVRNSGEDGSGLENGACAGTCDIAQWT